MAETNFEQRVRGLAETNPRLTVGTAVMLADRADGELIEFPKDPTDTETGAIWALQFPEVVDFLRDGKIIHAIKEIRSLAPPRVHWNSFGREVILGLREAKNVADRAAYLLSTSAQPTPPGPTEGAGA